jgi:mRNA interferase MazF
MKKGDIVLLPFPFADSNYRKVRPALVLGKTVDEFEDVIVCAISSTVPKEKSTSDVIVNPSSLNKLRVQSCIKTDRIATVRVNQIVMELGVIETETWEQVCSMISAILNC